MSIMSCGTILCVFRRLLTDSSYRGSAIAKIVAENTKQYPEMFQEEVRM